MAISDALLIKKETLAVVGLGYVGLPLAVEFARHVPVIGFDKNPDKIAACRCGSDPTREVGDEDVKASRAEWTDDEARLREALFLIVAVPTPIRKDTTPDLECVIEASNTVGRNLKKGAIVVYESTVYPGVTEEICVPILERASGMKCGRDFKVGYSPERINPGDKVHRLATITKIVSGMDAESREEIAQVYRLVVEAGVYRAPSIKVAEAAKVIENSQRDINIAFVNELAGIFHKMGIDTREVLDAAATKWNFLSFHPGLVGGHCIGVDPYYLTHRAEAFGYHSQVILSGRRVNDGMAGWVTQETVKELIAAGKSPNTARVACLGITFKEDCPDERNSKVCDLLKELQEYGIFPLVCDPVADAAAVKRAYGIDLVPMEKVRDLDCVILAVAHKQFRALPDEALAGLYKDEENEKKVLVDVKGIRNKDKWEKEGYRYWRL